MAMKSVPPSPFVALSLLFGAALAPPAQPPPPPAATPIASVQGFIVDSVHNRALGGALLSIEGTNRGTVSMEDGRFRIDSVPAGVHRIFIMHPILDTIGIQLVSDRINFLPGVTVTRDLAIPSAARLASTVCPRAVLQIRGPAVLMGFVRDPDSGKPAAGAKVELVYE